MKHTITLKELDPNITYSLEDNSPRGCKTVSYDDLKIGDKIVIDNYFHEIIEEPEVKTMRDKEQIVKEIIEYFEENEEVFNEIIEELDAWDGYLNDDRYYYMDELNELYNGVEPLELLNRVYYGHDEDSWTTDSIGNKSYGEFNPNRDYFTHNGYGNLISTDYKDYTSHLDKYFIDDLIENRSHIESIERYDDLVSLLDELEQEENEEE